MSLISGGSGRTQLEQWRTWEQVVLPSEHQMEDSWYHDNIMTQHYLTNHTTPVFLASTGVRWSTQLLIPTSLWWGAMCSHYWLLRTTLGQHVQEHHSYTKWTLEHVLIYLLNQTRPHYCFLLQLLTHNISRLLSLHHQWQLPMTTNPTLSQSSSHRPPSQRLLSALLSLMLW